MCKWAIKLSHGICVDACTACGGLIPIQMYLRPDLKALTVRLSEESRDIRLVDIIEVLAGSAACWAIDDKLPQRPLTDKCAFKLADGNLIVFQLPAQECPYEFCVQLQEFCRLAQHHKP